MQLKLLIYTYNNDCENINIYDTRFIFYRFGYLTENEYQDKVALIFL